MDSTPHTGHTAVGRDLSSKSLMAPKSTLESTYVKVKRHQSTTFLMLEGSAISCPSIKKALVAALNDCPGNTSVFFLRGEGSNTILTAEDVVLGVQDSSGKSSKTKYTILEEDAIVSDKLLVWRLKDEEEFQVEEYPDNDEQE